MAALGAAALTACCRWRIVAAALGATLQAGCASLGYYGQSVAGHMELMWERRPISEVLADPAAPEPLRVKLEQVRRARGFATTALGLPDNGSYRSFVDLDRPFVVWSVFATPEFSLAPKSWCFVFAGCVSYRGYFSESDANLFAAELKAAGHDVYVAGVRAYSTLGWFADPVPSSILAGPPHYAVGVIFHELAHQRLYVPDDSRFNEAFAVTVEREGVRRWLATEGSAAAQRAYTRSLGLQADFLALLAAARQQLATLYAGPLADAPKRAEKRRIFAQLRAEFRTRRERWGGDSRYDGWFEGGLNNAKLASVATYHDLVPAFEGLLASHGGDLPRFYAASERLGERPLAERHDALQAFRDDELQH